MAKTILENTREHDITINAVGNDGIVQVTVPAARQDQDDKTKLVHGRAEADDAFIAAAKENQVVAHYFEEGWLRIATPAKEPANKKAKE